MQIKLFAKPFRSKSVFTNIVLATMFLMLMVAAINLFGSSASAAPDPQDPVLVYCKDLKLNDKALKACTSSNVDAARNVATYKCDPDASSDKKVECVETKAKSYFKAAAGTKPKTEATMNTALDKQFTKALKGTGGSKDKPATGFGSLAADGQVCQGGKCSDPAADPNSSCDGDKCDLIKKYINPLINLLTIAFGIIAVGSLVFAGIQYSSSSGEPQKVTQAKNRIINTIIAIVAYFLLFGFLQFLIPGGIF